MAYSYDAKMRINEKMVNGVLGVSKYGVVFGNESRLLLRVEFDWSAVRIEQGIEIIRSYIVFKEKLHYLDIILADSFVRFYLREDVLNSVKEEIFRICEEEER